jgi:hypothetical protein
MMDKRKWRLLVILAVHLLLSGWVVCRFVSLEDGKALAVHLVLWGILPLILFAFLWQGKDWARGLLAGLFGVRAVGELTGLLVLAWVSFQDSATGSMGQERLAAALIITPAYLVMAILVMRSRPVPSPSAPVPGADAPGY